jgi:hypothetical protein
VIADQVKVTGLATPEASGAGEMLDGVSAGQATAAVEKVETRLF